MTKKTNENENSVYQEASEKIEKILLEHGLALQPFMQFSEYGIVPRVRLVTNEQDTNDEGADKKNTGRGKRKNGVTKS